MGKVYDSISKTLHNFIIKQPMFFVATAPLGSDGHVNMSPKGLDSFRILSPNKVAYLDMTGSGNETSAHINENGRITFMFCAFNGAPNIVRLYGTGRTVLPQTPEWDTLYALFEDYRGARQIIVADIHRVSTACGYAVPLMDLVGQRDTLLKWTDAKSDDDLIEYRQLKNACSIDGLETPLASAEGETTTEAQP